MDIKDKICTKCGGEKELSEYYKDKTKKDGYRPRCKQCINEYFSSRKEHISEYGRYYRQKNKKIIKEKMREYRQNNKKKNRNKKINLEGNKKCYICNEIKQKKQFNKDCTSCDGLSNRCRKCDNKQKRDNKERLYFCRKKRYHNDENFRLTCILRERVRFAIQTYSTTGKIQSTSKYGINYQEIIKHLGSCPGKRENYHVDHIIPLVKFNFNDPKQIKIAFSPENHQWLLENENREKHSRIIPEMIESKGIGHLTGSLDI